jgi:protoheme IX farnesyltransferase
LAQTALTALRSYADLTKPRLLPLVLFTGLPALGMAAGGWPSLGFAVLTILGISLAAASANTLNAYLERDKDALMDRTRRRPLPMGRIAPRAALGFGLVLGVAATALLYAVAGLPAAGLGVASILYYVFVYTVWAKPRSAWNAVIGAAAGGGGAGGGGPPPPPAPAQNLLPPRHPRHLLRRQPPETRRLPRRRRGPHLH